MKMNEDLTGLFLTEVGGPKFDPDQWFQVTPEGVFEFDDYGKVNMTPDVNQEIVANYKANVREGGVPINIEHLKGPGAIAWVKDMEYRPGSGTWAKGDWGNRGTELMKDKAFRYFSPEIRPEWKHPRTGQIHKNVVVGVAATNYHRFRGMEAILCSEDGPQRVKRDEFAAVQDFADDTKPATDKQRARMDTSSFAFVGLRKILINTKGRCIAALGRFMQVTDEEGNEPSDSQRDAAWARLKSARTKFGLDTPDSWRSLGKEMKAAEDRLTMMLADLETLHMDQAIGEMKPTDEMDTCPSCGEDLPDLDDMEYCPYCGADLDQKQEPKKMSEPKTETQPKAEPQATPPASPETAHVTTHQFAELNTKIASFAEKLEASEKARGEAEAKVQKMSEELDAVKAKNAQHEAARRMSEREHALEKLLEQGKATPAQLKVFTEGAKAADGTEEDAAIVDMSDRDWARTIKGFEVLPKGAAVKFGERGVTAADAPLDTTVDDNRTLKARADQIFAEAKAANAPLTKREAYIRADKELNARR